MRSSLQHPLGLSVKILCSPLLLDNLSMLNFCVGSCVEIILIGLEGMNVHMDCQSIEG